MQGTPIDRQLSKFSNSNCNDPSSGCSPFVNVSLVLGVTAAERVPWLLDYTLWFGSVHFLVPMRECDECHCRISDYTHGTPLACDCQPGFNSTNDFNHAAASIGMQRAANSALALGLPLRGVLFAHMDMWVNVRSNLYHTVAPFDSIWMPKDGLLSKPNAPFCSASGQNWQRRVPRYVSSATPMCNAIQSPMVPSVSGPSTRPVVTSLLPGKPLKVCCFGWSDMYYVPTSALEAFVTLVSALSTVFGEVAVPTVADILQREANISWWKIPCIGNCCHQVSTPSRFDPRVVTTMCGHKLALDKPQYRGMLTRTLYPNYTRATELVHEDFGRFTHELKESGQKYSSHHSLTRNISRIRRCASEFSRGAWNPAWVLLNSTAIARHTGRKSRRSES